MLEFFRRKTFPKGEGPVCALLMAAGSGRRMRSKSSKYLIEILGKPVIAHTLEVFQEAPAVDEVILVTKEEDIVLLGDIVKAFSFDKVTKIIAGGATRQESVACGLCELPEETRYVLVHDGVRPFVTCEQIDRLLDEAKDCGGSVLAVKCKDTLRTADENRMIAGQIDRENTYLIQTPQCFEADMLRQAYDAAKRQGLEATDDATLVCAAGNGVRIVEGDYDNIKITTPEDLFIAESILRKRGELFEDW